MPTDIPSLETDPCGRATALRARRDDLILGGGVVETESESGNHSRKRVKFSAADLGRLDAEIQRAEDACAKLSGGRSQRFAVTPRRGGW